VHYLMEGSVRRSGDRLRIATQLVEAATGTQIWAERYDGALAEEFELQDRITESVMSDGNEERHENRVRLEQERQENLEDRIDIDDVDDGEPERPDS